MGRRSPFKGGTSEESGLGMASQVLYESEKGRGRSVGPIADVTTSARHAERVRRQPSRTPIAIAVSGATIPQSPFFSPEATMPSTTVSCRLALSDLERVLGLF